MNDVIRHGRAAWDRLKKGSGLWADWVFVGHALLDGRKIALHNAGIQRAHGSGYTDAFSSWMIDNQIERAAVGAREAIHADGIYRPLRRGART